MKIFWTYFWVIWFAMLVIGDPIATWLSRKDHVGDTYTDTHLLVTHISVGLRIAVLAWLAYHFLVAHKVS